MHCPEFIDIKSHFTAFRSVLFILIFCLLSGLLVGQQTPYHPLSYRIFSPFLFNPAMAGSKDFSSLDVISGWQGKSNSQLISVNSRITKKGPSYFMSPVVKAFTNIGIGGYLFNEDYSPSRNMGAGAICSYQIPLDKQSLSFLSFGVAVKGIYNTMDSVYSADPGLSMPSESTFYPNLDAGIYYYGPSLFAGFSVTNLLGNPGDPDSLGIYRIPASRQYFFVAGYKFLISKPLNLVLEPSLIINGNTWRYHKITDIIKPMLKIYAQDFCVGTYFNDYDNISFFFQYRYPRFYVGTFFEMPKKTAYYKKDLNVEFAVGVNFSAIKSKNLKYYHW
jgi:type IX secretion system PorP/SprF family membrane protein